MGLLGLDPVFIATFIPVLLFALTFHEASHAWMALRFGDPTARSLGRLTLNPLAHLDLFGTVAVFLIGFGWAKPVPVALHNMSDPKRGMLWTAAAGPLSNLLLALTCGVIVRGLILGGWEGGYTSSPTMQIVGRLFGMGLILNVSLAVFNLIPLPPLDGSKIILGVAPRSWELPLMRLQRVGPMLLLMLIAMGFFLHFSPIWLVMGPFVELFCYLLSGVSFGDLQLLMWA